MARVEMPPKEKAPSANQQHKELEALIAQGKEQGEDLVVRRKEKGFISEVADEGKDFVVNQIVMPTVKEMIFNVFAGIFDILKDTVEAKIFGIDDVGRSYDRGYRDYAKPRRRTTGSRYLKDRMGYNSLYDDRRGGYAPRTRDVTNYESVIFRDMYLARLVQDEALNVFEERGGFLKVSDYKKVIADILDQNGVRGVYTMDDITYIDEDWGWYNLNTMLIKPMRNGGYAIDMPRPKPLD